MELERRVAYFSMEIAIEPEIPTYSGGLGVLAGDTIRSSADVGVPMVGVSLLHRKGYFRQRLDASGWQTEQPEQWSCEEHLEEMPPRVAVKIEGRDVLIRAWKCEVKGSAGYTVPVYLLDTDLPENSEEDRSLTHYLYGGDERYRICQELILGIGGVRMLKALGHRNIQRYHLNEGHASFLSLELLREKMSESGSTKLTDEHIQAVKRMCVFTTHTPVEAGHDKFPVPLARRVIGEHPVFERQELFCHDGRVNMTFLALNLSHYVNGVAKRHGELSQEMFHAYRVDSITNGVHAGTWVSPPFQELFDKYIPGWRGDNFSLRYALGIPRRDVWDAHITAKRALLDYISEKTGIDMEPNVLTIGFARRATAYKRLDLIFQGIDRLRKICPRTGILQIVIAGKAHPRDTAGKELIKRIFEAKQTLRNNIKIAYLENYNMEIGKLMSAGVDIWLNTPQPPLEASGTSGMKSALNGVPSFSVLDGWWIEGWIEGVTGWAIGDDHRKSAPASTEEDAESLYHKLERVIIPTFYQERQKFIEMMLHCIALNGSFFNTQRMIQQYVLKAYYK